MTTEDIKTIMDLIILEVQHTPDSSSLQTVSHVSSNSDYKYKEVRAIMNLLLELGLLTTNIHTNGILLNQ